MHASVTVPMVAQADEIWNIVADVRNTGKFSPEVIEAEWLTAPRAPRWAHASVDMCGATRSARSTGRPAGSPRASPAEEFGFEVLVGDRPVNNWHYRFTPADGGTEVTESFRMNDNSSPRSSRCSAVSFAPDATSAICARPWSGSRRSWRRRQTHDLIGPRERAHFDGS